MIRPWRKPGWRGLWLGALCGLVAWGATRWPLLAGRENGLQDGAFFFRGVRHTSAKVVVVGLDEASLDALHKPLPWISPELAQVVRYLKIQGAAAVGIDLIVPASLMTLPELQADKPGAAAAMNQAVDEAGNVVLAEAKFGTSWLHSLPQWRFTTEGAIAEGFANTTPDPDYFLRRQLLYAKTTDDGQEAAHTHLALALFARAWHKDVVWDGQHLRVGEDRVPLDDEQKLPINYVGPPGTFPVVPFHEVLAAARTGKKLPQDFLGAVVIVGITAPSQQDYHPTPYSNSFWWNQHDAPQLMSGCEIHANLLATLHDRAFIHEPPWPVTLALLVIFGMFLGRVLGFLNLGAGLLLMTGHHFAWKLTVPVVFGLFNLRLELVSMLMLGLLLYAVTFSLRWRRLRSMLGVIKSESIARLLENDPGQLDLRGEERVVTVLFADIRGFGQFSKQHAPPEVMGLLNAYYTAIVPVIEEHGGTLNLYMGDGIMVLFNAPFACPQHALQAVRAARAIVRRVAQLRATWTELDCPHFAIGVGIHTGPVIVGTVGSPRRLDYTALGETINSAARIEARTKHFGVAILISAATYHDLPAKERERLGCCPQPRLAEEKEMHMDVHVVQAPALDEKAT